VSDTGNFVASHTRAELTTMNYKLPLVFEPQPEGGYTVTSPLLPELVTEGDTIEDALDNVRDALAAVVEAYREQGKVLPSNLVVSDPTGPVWTETLITVP
jgi:antitoxin HicB